MKVEFHKPHITADTIAQIHSGLTRGILRGNGPGGERVERFLCTAFGAKHALFTTSCSHALELAMIVLNLSPGDEVILPSFTFASCANAILLRGAKPVFADIDPRTMNLDPAEIKKRMNLKTKVIMPVHYAGIACNMDEILGLVRGTNIRVIEDAAQGVDARYRDKYLGTIGDLGCYSFHETKNLTCGEGGALLTSNEELFLKAEIVREKGTNRSAFLRGKVDKYTWVEIGSSYVQSDLLASILYQQFLAKDKIRESRRRIFNRYMDEFRPLEDAGLLRLPFTPQFASPNFHIFFLILESEKTRNYLIAELSKAGIGAVFHYIPLHSSPMGQRALGYKPEDLPVTEDLSRRLVRLPIYPDLSDDQQTYVIDRVKAILSRKSQR